jgi:hypothetical protein
MADRKKPEGLVGLPSGSDDGGRTLFLEVARRGRAGRDIGKLGPNMLQAVHGWPG